MLGDFLKEGGVSVKQDNLMSKQYLQHVNGQTTNADAPPNYFMWARIGVIDGLKYLSRHFQIVIFNRDTHIEDMGANYSQV